MLNYRRIDRKFSISGGWQDVPEDIDYLKDENIVAILDLQFTDNDSQAPVSYCYEQCQKAGIDYRALRMDDGETENTVQAMDIFQVGVEIIESLVEKYPDKKQRILIKCGVGVSRSPAMFIAYLCQTERWTYDEAKQVLDDSEWDLMETGELTLATSLNPFFKYVLQGMYGRTEYEFKSR